MSAILGIMLLAFFMIAQGAVVFGTAFLALRLLKSSHWLAKAAAMTLSYVAWIILTITGYSLLGGEGGLMDGFGMALMLCFTALISSVVYGIVWMVRGSPDRTLADG